MSMVMTSKVNSPVGEKDLLFLISLLDREDKVEFVKEFREDFEQQIEEKKLSKTAYYKFLNGYAPADERVLEVALRNKEARRWIMQRVKEKARRALEIIEKNEG
ncbi:conserved hypothetical protein [Sulfolobus islandicus L.S.2.15]|uniref:Uncharacterized protein n=1 Tax=Saccharolobus islandicus (strain L.S.2.15 / Lassen \|nr:hypothetical protein [Sulfolobus islandicus]ACP36035.1 conserved hypothetical protein [Sulfolobus islandicus L.S.2.15]